MATVDFKAGAGLTADPSLHGSEVLCESDFGG
jgi:hypothetical protein